MGRICHRVEAYKPTKLKHVTCTHLETLWSACLNEPTGSLQRQAAFSCGRSHASAVDLERTSGSGHRCGSGGTWCWGQSCELPCVRVNSIMHISWSQQEWYSLNPLMDISPVPPAASWENLKHMDSPNNNHTHAHGSASFHRFICNTYHCNISISPVAVVTVVHKAGRLARKNSQCLFWQQSPGCQHDLVLISLF